RLPGGWFLECERRRTSCREQKREAEHIEEGYEQGGVSEQEAERRAWATVNKATHGGRKSGSRRGTKEDQLPSRKGGVRAGPSPPRVRPRNVRSRPRRPPGPESAVRPEHIQEKLSWVSKPLIS